MAPLASLQELWLSVRGVERYHRLLKRSQYWAPQELAAFQTERLRRLLTEAGDHIPYYGRRFAAAGFDPRRDVDSVTALRALPVLDKETARRDARALAHPTRGRRAVARSTSGSTGEPFTVQVSLEQRAIERATVLRAWRWAGYTMGARVAVVRSYIPKDGEPLWHLNRIENALYFSAYHLTPTNARTYLAELARWRPRILRGYASSLYILARMAEELDVRVSPVQGIVSASETLLPEYRDCIERVFGARVFDWYGQQEATVTMAECEAHRGLHIHTDYGVCELLPDPALAADERRIIATNLHNLAMPLIRYDTGDVAVVDGETSCSCGRSFPLVRAIKGRSDDLIRTRSGRIIPSVNFYTVFYHFGEIRAFQLVQHALDSVEVRIETSGMNATSRARLRQELIDRIGSDVHFEFRENVGLEQSPDGKKRVVISRL